MSGYILNARNFQGFQVGEKARTLFVMERSGIEIPPLFCVDSGYLRFLLMPDQAELERILAAVCYRDGNSIADAAGRIQGGIAETGWEEEFVPGLGGYLDAHFPGEVFFSVRSSALEEDSAGASFAGQFDTYLQVPRPELPGAIARCYRSLYNAGALGYCRQKGISPAALNMSVIVQRMITPERSGVVFTSNPQGLLNELVVVCGAGAGNLVVEDKIPVSTTYYNKTDNLSYSEIQPGAAALEPELLERIVSMANTLVELLGDCLDIEYAVSGGRLYILQARPITALPQGAPTVLDNSNIVESYPGATLPLSASFAKRAYYGVFRGLARRCFPRGGLAEQQDGVLRQMVELCNGRMYYKISNWYTIIQFLPCRGRIIPLWQEMLGVHNKEYKAGRIPLSPLDRARTYRNILREMCRIPQKMTRLEERFDAVNGYFTEQFRSGLDNAGLLRLYSEIEERVLLHWDITLLNDLYAFVFVGLLKSRLKKLGIPGCEERANQIISGMSGIESMKPVRAMAELVRRAVEEGRIAALATLRTGEAVRDYLRENPSAFADSFREYTRLYGDRYLEELKLESETFRSSPALLAAAVVGYAGNPEGLDGLGRAFQDEGEALPQGLPSGGFINKKLLAFFAGKAKLGIRNRELSRLNRSRIYGMVRAIFLQVGENLAGVGALEQVRDVFYLEMEELDRYAQGAACDLKALVERRKEQYRMYAQLPMYTRLVFAGEAFSKSHRSIHAAVAAGDRKGLRGTPCSNGIAVGEVVVIRNPGEATDVAGKILVTKMTDPGWVFLLTAARGIIAERGSLLSHTAIISRELGIPSVVGVSHATDTLKTGDTVRLDGGTGEITVMGGSDD